MIINPNESAIDNHLLVLSEEFCRQAISTPDKIAVIDQNEQLTYAQLNQQANRLAHYLQQHGVKPGQLIGISIAPSVAMTVAVFGILKAGGAFVPLDPGYPADRLAWMIQDSQIGLIVTTAATARQLGGQHAELVFLDTLPADAPMDSPSVTPDPNQLACCLYTSGSTGQPKGVLIEHHALTRHCLGVASAYDYSQQDRGLLFASLNYVAALEQLFLPLLIGASLVIREPDLWDSASFPVKIRGYGISVVDLPPGYWHTLLADWQNSPESLENLPLRLIILGGDETRPETVALWQQSPLRSRRFLNAYGMTETPVTSALFEIPKDGDYPRVPIGTPAPNWRIDLLDSQLQTVAAGEDGEICIGGDSLARGYLNQPELTAEKFVRHPKTQERLYRTGDLGRFLADGNLEYRGRLDHQVQIRGFRVELGEIEQTLLTHPKVQEAAVIAFGEDTEKQLVAYAVCPKEASIWQVQGSYRDEPGVIIDTTERLEFKLKQVNIQSFKGHETTLAKPAMDEALVQNYLSRQSYRQFAQQPIPLDALSHLLSCLMQLKLPDAPIPKYRYPSALGLYPVQTYVQIKPERVEGMAGGFYYYHPQEHRLQLIAEHPELSDDVYGAYNQAITRQAAFSLLLVAHLEAIKPLYGQKLAEKFCIAEAGYMGQLLMTEAPNRQLGLCPLGDLAEFPKSIQVHQALGLSDEQRVVQCFLGGAIEQSQTKTWLQETSHQQTPAELKAGLKAFLQEKLPAHMVPEQYVLCEQLPKTPNGKIDRKALPAPELQPSMGFSQPATPTEALLAVCWANVLKRDAIGRNDHFFELGGHSLLATQLVARIRESFQIELPIRAIFEHPQLAQLATAIDNAGGTPALPPIGRQADGLPKVLSFSQQWFWLLSQLDSQGTAHHMFHAWKLTGNLDEDALRQTFSALVARHQSLRLCFPQIGGEVGVAVLPAYEPLTTLDIRHLPEALRGPRLIELQQEAVRQPFALAYGPLFRVRLVKTAGQEHYLFLTVHHIIFDAWSTGILLRDWQTLYTALCQGQTPELPALPIDYTDYAAWQRSCLQGEALQRQMDFWLGQLHDAPELLKLPTDFTRPETQQNQGGMVELNIAPELTTKLKQLARQQGCTLHMVLFSGFVLLLQRYSGQRDISVGIPLVMRHQQHTDTLLGLLLNMLVLRTRLSTGDRFIDLLKQVRHNALEAYAHQDMPFERLVQQLRPERQTAYNPYFQVMFNLVNTPGTGELTLPGLQAEAWRAHDENVASSNLDIVFTLYETLGGIEGAILFDKALFKSETIRYWVDGYTALLEQAVTQPEALLRDFVLSQNATPRYPLTSSQREIWFEQMLHDDLPLYNIGGYVHLPGPMDAGLFEQAANLLAEKHDTLCTLLVKERDEDGIPLQTYAASLAVNVPLHDFSGQGKAQAFAWMQQRFVEKFELNGQPLFRYDLVKVSETEYYWLMQYHHLIVDGFGIALLNRSLAEIYTHLAKGETPDLDSPSYTDFIHNDRAYVESDVFAKQRQYWLAKYPTAPEPLLTPRYRAHFPGRLAASGCEALYLPRAFYQQLGELAKRHQASTFHVLLGALYVYFTRTSGRDEFAIGLPVLNRANASFKQTAGLFTGVSPTLFDFGQGLSFGELLQEINKTLKANYRHQRFPVSEVNRAVSSGSERSVLFDVSLSYENHDYDAEFSGIGSHTTPLLHGFEQTPLMIFVRDFHAQSEVEFDFVYSLGFFDAAEVKALQGRFVGILAAALRNGDAAIQALPVMTEAEALQLQAWNDTATDYPKDQTLVDLFEAQVERTPDTIAVVFEDQSLTYRQLNAKANRLAHHLLNLAKPDGQPLLTNNPLIAIAVERSLDMIIGLLAILKAGGAYVPIDPSYPASRIRYMLDDSQAPLLLTQSHLTVLLSLDGLEHDCVELCLDATDVADQPGENLPARSTAEDLAYVIYTSGSTGKPKGVMVENNGLVNLALAQIKAFEIDATSRILQFASFSFDASASEISTALLNGARLTLIAKETLLDTAQFSALLVGQQITHVTLPPSFLNNLSEQAFSDLKTLVVAGEACPVEMMKRWSQNLHFINAYGPTENTVCASAAVCFPGMDAVSIGKPIANTRIYILNAQHQLQPLGIPGELCIAGAGLARGYLNRPELTAEKFIEVELFDKTERIYKTGDLARWLPDGNLEFLGRIDHQVKLRGFRIELGEIEAVLGQFEHVKEAAVSLYEADGNKRLVAYIVVSGQWLVASGQKEGLDIHVTSSMVTDHWQLTTALATFLKAKLPDYMIPASFMILDSLPLTPNGKLDRKALPAPDKNTRSESALPRDNIELQLASLWETVLNVPSVGIHDDFFSLGGHSLLAVKLMNHIREQFSARLPISALFQHPTVASLAELLRQEGTRRFTELVPIHSTGTTNPVYCLPGAFGSVMYLYPLATRLGAQQRFYALQTPGLDGSAIPETIEALARHHLKLVRQQQAIGPYQLVGYSSGGRVAFEMAWQLEQQGETVSLLVILDANAPGFKSFNSSELECLEAYVHLYEQIMGNSLNLPSETIRTLPDIETAYAVVAQTFLQHQLLFDPKAAIEELKAMVNVVQITGQALADHPMPGKVRCPIHLFRASEQSADDEVNDTREAWGWTQCTHATVTEHWVPGDHLSMMLNPHVKTLAEKLSRYLSGKPV